MALIVDDVAHEVVKAVIALLNTSDDNFKQVVMCPCDVGVALVHLLNLSSRRPIRRQLDFTALCDTSYSTMATALNNVFTRKSNNYYLMVAKQFRLPVFSCVFCKPSDSTHTFCKCSSDNNTNITNSLSNFENRRDKLRKANTEDIPGKEIVSDSMKLVSRSDHSDECYLEYNQGSKKTILQAAPVMSDITVRNAKPIVSQFSDRLSSSRKVNDEKRVVHRSHKSVTKRNKRASVQGVKSLNIVYVDYTGTDFDQPTDYSLKYAEDDDLDLDKKLGPSIVNKDDCNQTPLNLSKINLLTSLSSQSLTDKDKQIKHKTTRNFLKSSTESATFLPNNVAKHSGLISLENPVINFEEGSSDLFYVNAATICICTDNTLSSANNHAEETPLMFSRCSSLESLNSCDQHSIIDDLSSLVSDFSRVVSPSELPDSPSQTMPPSPKQTKSFSQAFETLGGKPNFFQDDIADFKTEDTPFEFSRATSLSSLTIDDDSKILEDIRVKKVTQLDKPQVIIRLAFTHKETDNIIKKQDEEKCYFSSYCCELEQLSDCEEEEILAACINIGIQNSVQKHKTPVTAGVCDDAILLYCTEGTPANLSNAGSQSDLLACDLDKSAANRARLKEASDESSNESILAESIQSGMLTVTRKGR